MLRVIVLVLLPVLAFGQGKEKAVDRIKSKEDLKAFVNRSLGKEKDLEWKEKFILSLAWSVDDYEAEDRTAVRVIREQCARLGVRAWFNADFNGDNRSDLLVTTSGKDAYCFISQPDGGFVLNYLGGGSFFDYMLISRHKVGGKDAVVLSRYTKGTSSDAEPWKQDTVIFIQGRFLNYNPNPDSARITRVSLELDDGGCETPEAFVMNLDSAGRMMNFREFNYDTMEVDTVFSSVGLDSVALLFNILRYAGSGLKDKYKVPTFDDCTFILRILYADKREKVIKDYGEQGSYSLMAVYGLMNEWRLRLNWKKVE